MFNKQIAPPYKPILESNTDTKHFDQEILDMPIESPTNDMGASGGNGTSSYMDEDDYNGFSFEAKMIPSPQLNNSGSLY